ncbi:MAG TPA: DUF3108 domain-containing protein [Burkholderiaceae bacterium]|nr:DUF3108 domain-containing protein [Burkholderiaceae bacterium]
MEARIVGWRRNVHPLRPGFGQALALGLAVFGVHAWMLAGTHTVGHEATRPGRIVLRLRPVPPSPVPALAIQPAAPAADASESSRQPPRRRAPSRSGSPSPTRAPADAGPAGGRPSEPAANPDTSDATVQTPAVVQPMPPPLHAASGDLEIPIYPTHLPPSLSWRYGVTRGSAQGQADLVWRRDGDRYEAGLQVDGAAGPLQWHSHGEIDTAGVAPVRFVDQRARRAAQAANFRRGQGRITYSGSAAELPLMPGSQDRLSWLLQLAGIAQAQPQRWNLGERIVLHVSGARADADAWSFEVAGREALELPAGKVEALKLVREPGRPYDIRAEVWLDPERHHMPVRVRMTNGQARFEMILQAELSVF